MLHFCVQQRIMVWSRDIVVLTLFRCKQQFQQFQKNVGYVRVFIWKQVKLQLFLSFATHCRSWCWHVHTRIRSLYFWSAAEIYQRIAARYTQPPTTQLHVTQRTTTEILLRMNHIKRHLARPVIEVRSAFNILFETQEIINSRSIITNPKNKHIHFFFSWRSRARPLSVQSLTDWMVSTTLATASSGFVSAVLTFLTTASNSSRPTFKPSKILSCRLQISDTRFQIDFSAEFRFQHSDFQITNSNFRCPIRVGFKV